MRSMPTEILQRWLQPGVRVELNVAPRVGQEPERLRSVFREPSRIDQDAELVVHRPQAFIEHPMGILG